MVADSPIGHPQRMLGDERTRAEESLERSDGSGDIVGSPTAQIECIDQRRSRLRINGGTGKPGQGTLLWDHGVQFPRSIDAHHTTRGRSRRAVESGQDHLQSDTCAGPRIPAGRRLAPRAEASPLSCLAHQCLVLMAAHRSRVPETRDREYKF